MAYSKNSRVSDLLENEEAVAILEKHIPGFTSKDLNMVRKLSLKEIAVYPQSNISQEQLMGCSHDLEKIQVKDGQQIENKNETTKNTERELFGLHRPVMGCLGNCETCDYELKSKATMEVLQIDLTHLCTLACHNCDRHIDIAPATIDQNVTFEQIERLINESIEADHKWECIMIIGGEPTIHPQFREIVKMIVAYKDNYNKDMEIKLASNGHTKKTREELKWVEDNYPFVYIDNTSKTSNIQEHFINIRNAPKDRIPESTHFERCHLPCYGGMAFNYSGFYGCGTGGATAKIFGYDIGIKSVKDLTYENLEKMYNIICPLCGHWDCEESSKELNNQTNFSKSWVKAMDKYKVNGVSGITRY